MSLMTAVANELFKKRDSDGIFIYVNPDMQKTRGKIANFPGNIYSVYILPFSTTLFIISICFLHYHFLQTFDQPSHIAIGPKGNFFDINNFKMTLSNIYYISNEALLPFCIMFFLGYVLYVVRQTKTICDNYFNGRNN